MRPPAVAFRLLQRTAALTPHMLIVTTRTIDGPNVFSHSPIVLMTLDLQDLHERESSDLPGFVDRLREGTYFGHVVEHVAIAWGTALGATGNYGKTVRSARPHCFDIVVSSLVHQATRHLLHGAVAFVEATVRNEAFDAQALLDAARRLVDHTALGPST